MPLFEVNDAERAEMVIGHLREAVARHGKPEHGCTIFVA
jgi:hypothetical protein